jgi:hypothetical protein
VLSTSSFNPKLRLDNLLWVQEKVDDGKTWPSLLANVLKITVFSSFYQA